MVVMAQYSMHIVVTQLYNDPWAAPRVLSLVVADSKHWLEGDVIDSRGGDKGPWLRPLCVIMLG
jgi:hypothetical protein